MSKTKNEKWIEVITKRDGRSYTTAIRCSDVTAMQKTGLSMMDDTYGFHKQKEHQSVRGTVVDIHVSSGTIFTTVVTPIEANEIWNRVTGDEEE